MFDLSNVDEITIYQAILDCKNQEDLEAFIHDLLSPDEIKKASKRWNIAKIKLATNCSQNSLEKARMGTQDMIKRTFDELNTKINPFEDRGYRRVFRSLIGKPFDEL